MHFPPNPFLIKLLVFGAAVLPLLIGNMRTKTVSNENNFILFTVGIVVTIIEQAAGVSHQSSGSIAAWMAVMIVAVLLFFVFNGHAGVCKTFLAILPWFPNEQFLIVVFLGMVPAGWICKAIQKEDFQVVLPLTLASYAVLLF